MSEETTCYRGDTPGGPPTGSAPGQVNRALLRGRPEGQDYLPLPGPGPKPEPEWLPGTFPALRVQGEAGRAVTLHSPREPWKEADDLVEQAGIAADMPVVVLGLGLGYHVLRLLEALPPDQRVIVVERRREVWGAALLALDLTPLLSREKSWVVVTDDPEEAVRQVRRSVGEECGGRVQFFSHPPSRRADPGFYQDVVDSLGGGLRPVGRPVRGSAKDTWRILILNTDYFLIPEVIRALRHLGHDCQNLFIDKRRDQGGEVVRRILHLTAAYQPDLIFTINHLGFDREGILIDAFRRAGIPSASWYVDSPRIILNLYQGPPSEMVHIFLWDRSYGEDVRRLGFERVHELPLATDPGIFRPRPGRELKKWRTRVSFVGNSMVGPTEKKLSRLPQNPWFQRLWREMAEVFRQQPFQRLHDVLESRGWLHHPALARLSLKEWTDFEAGLVWLTTRDYRLEMVRQLAATRPTIYGDPGWRELLGPDFRLCPEVNYYDELPLVFAASEINFNATSLQMQTAVNQRVFDVPATGGLLLTDFRDQLGELFELGREVVCYREAEEIGELADYYLRHESERRRVAEAGRRRVLAEHTYVHRVRRMLDILRRER